MSKQVSDMDFNMCIMGGKQPLYEVLNASAWDKEKTEWARWDTQSYPGENIYLNFSVPIGQVNKADKTQFELKSDREGHAPMIYTSEYIQLYSGDSTGNEPKLEVSYYVDNPIIINDTTWLWRNATTDKVAIVLFGAKPFTYDLYVRSIDLKNANPPEKSAEKINFLDALIQHGFSVLTPKNNTMANFGGGYYYTYYGASSSWLEEATLWMKDQGYSRLFLFGFSGGGTVTGREIQKNYATRFGAAVASCAPVEWSTMGAIYHTATTSSNAKVPICLPEGVDDWFYYNMTLYRDNAIVDKEWHDWYGGHDFFNKTCSQHANENASDVVITGTMLLIRPAHPLLLLALRLQILIRAIRILLALSMQTATTSSMSSVGETGQPTKLDLSLLARTQPSHTFGAMWAYTM